MIVLAVETSCDETSVAVLKDGNRVLSNIVASQEKIHSKYFGVVPELASRAHIENINWVLEKALVDSGIKRKPDLIAFTSGPGLMGSLLVGQMVAQVLSYVYDVPLIEVNHLEGHIFGAVLEYPGLKPPFLSLIISGGHTEIIVVEKKGVYRVLGQTRDDACGEAFDKVAKLLTLGYPGGPIIEKKARDGNAGKINFPRPYMRDSWDFSFSGLKTAVLYYLQKHPVKGNSEPVNDICASFQQAVIDTLLGKTLSCSKKFGIKKIAVVGGVAANRTLRNDFSVAGAVAGVKFYFPRLEYCTDNAAMIAAAGYHRFLSRSGTHPGSGYKYVINTKLPLRSWQ